MSIAFKDDKRGAKASRVLRKVPVELWEHVFHFLIGAELLPTLRTCKGFNAIAKRPLQRVIHWRTVEAFQGWNDSPLAGRMLYVPCEVTIGSKSPPHPYINFNHVFPVITSFQRLTTLSLYRIAFPLVNVIEILSKLPSLRQLMLHDILRIPHNMMPSTRRGVPVTSTSLRSITLNHVQGSPLTGDRGLAKLVEVLSMEGLQEIHMTLTTFIDLMESINTCRQRRVSSDSPEPPFPKLPNTLRTFEVHTNMYRENSNTDFLDYPEYSKILGKWLMGCTNSLEVLSLWISGDIPTPPDVIELRRLVMYTGPHSFLRALRFGPDIRRIWVPTPEVQSVEAWQFSRSVASSHRSAITHLSVQKWDVTDTSLEQLMTDCPNLKELSLVPSIALNEGQYRRLPVLLEDM
ncbi:hypothetical protein V5O48_007536 [Marasmius crinis-equi]|uniref:F-box domain-containing protein n=1 Tax=Marasmius crinis-equi TaxID=585013 RepID=A0ABR3FGV1_9AGAR